jgi:arylsulfatase
MLRCLPLILLAACAAGAPVPVPPRPNVVIILADDLGFSDIEPYGSEIPTPNLSRLAAEGLRFTQFYNAARCCPTRAALLTGLYPHQAGVGHMLQDWGRPGYAPGLNDRVATIAERLRDAGYRSYHVGKWHVGGFGPAAGRNFPLDRGFERAVGTAGGGNYFDPKPLYEDRRALTHGPDIYVTDFFTDAAVRFIEEHARDYAGRPFFLHLCYTAPHFPLQAKPADIARHRGRYRDGWDRLRERRFARQQALGICAPHGTLSPRDPAARAWEAVPEAERDEWELRMAVHAAMIDCMDQGIGRVLEALGRAGVERDTLVLFLSDNGASAEALDSWPNPGRGHKPGSVVGTRESHRCLEIGWANAANTPLREHKMWVHEGGIATPLIARWPAGIGARGALTDAVGHVIDLVPTFVELAGAGARPQLAPLEGTSLVPALRGGALAERTLAWEHEGNRALRRGRWKLVASFGGPWELYDLEADRTETRDRAAEEPERVRELAAAWEAWARRVGVVPWEQLPGANYRPSAAYRKK